MHDVDIKLALIESDIDTSKATSLCVHTCKHETEMINRYLF